MSLLVSFWMLKRPANSIKKALTFVLMQQKEGLSLLAELGYFLSFANQIYLVGYPN